MTKINPLDDRVLVKVIDEPQPTTNSAIILPENIEKEKPMFGEVKAVGDSEMIKVKPGDTILFAKFSGTEVKIGKEDYLVLQASDILATVKFD